MSERDEDMYEPEVPETTPDGTPVFRHQARDREFEIAASDPDLIDAINTHIQRHIGPVKTVYHEIISDLVHIDVHMVEATAERPFHVLVTSGMAERPMNAPRKDLRYAELCILLPPSWPLESDKWKDEDHYWPIRWLKTLARMPHEYATFLWAGHTVPNGDPAEPFAPCTELSGIILLPTLSLPEEFGAMEMDGGKTVHFWTVWPLHEDEMNLKLRHGADALIEALEKQGVRDVIDPLRPSACQPRKRGWFSRR